MVIRDNQGLVFAALSMTIQALSDPSTAEAVEAPHAVELSCDTIQALYDPSTAEAVEALHAVELSCDSRLQQVILEGDSKNVVLALAAVDSSYSWYRQVVNDVKVVLRTGFQRMGSAPS